MFIVESSHHKKNTRYLTGYIGTLTVMASDPQSNIKEIEDEIKYLGREFTKVD